MIEGKEDQVYITKGYVNVWWLLGVITEEIDYTYSKQMRLL